MERTLIILKPDAVQRRAMGEIISRFEKKGLKVVGMKFKVFPDETLEEHYAEHKEKPFFRDVVGFMTSGPICVLALEGNNAIKVSRMMIGKTKVLEAEPGTIRGDLSMSGQCNLIHGSDSPESAARELDLWFDPNELVEYEMAGEKWLAE